MSIPREKIALLVINLIAGGSVIASYIQGVLAHPGKSAKLWGNVPPGLIPFYTVSMVTAAMGYLMFTFYLLFYVNPDNSKIFGHYSFPLFNWLYAIILIFSALWMPLTFIMLDHPSTLLWLAIRFVLAAVGLGSIFFFAALYTLQPTEPALAHYAALTGVVFFALQTAVLDAIVWPAYFPYSLR
jgi:hypothetical protein